MAPICSENWARACSRDAVLKREEVNGSMPPHCAKCTHADLGQSIETIVGHYCFSEEFRLSFEDAAEGGRRDFVSEKQGRSGSENFSKSFK